MGADMAGLLKSGRGANVTFQVENETMKAHSVILETRFPTFRLVNRVAFGVLDVKGVKAPVFATLLRFVYTDVLPEVQPNLLNGTA